jgi:hypothetical protein
MALIKNINGRQWLLVAEAVIDLAKDSFWTTAGAWQALSAGGALVADAVPLPPNAVLVGGHLNVEVASDATTHTLAIGDVNAPARYLAATDLKAVAKTLLTLTGYRGVGEDIRFTFAGTGVPTVGRFAFCASYYVVDRANENQPN